MTAATSVVTRRIYEVRLSLIDPNHLTRELVEDACSLVGARLSSACLTPNELLLAYDWAMRVHMRAGDHGEIRARPRPSFVHSTELTEEQVFSAIESLDKLGISAFPSPDRTLVVMNLTPDQGEDATTLDPNELDLAIAALTVLRANMR